MDNLVALVTGANKGIGKEVARQLADTGLTVYVGSREAARGERAVEEIGGDTRLLVLDVTDSASIADAARQVGTLDILVNNAGISGDDKTPDEENAGTFRRIYETNIFGVVAVTNALGPQPGGPDRQTPPEFAATQRERTSSPSNDRPPFAGIQLVRPRRCAAAGAPAGPLPHGRHDTGSCEEDPRRTVSPAATAVTGLADHTLLTSMALMGAAMCLLPVVVWG